MFMPGAFSGKQVDTGDLIIYFDCFSGISGDMSLGALLDAGVDRAELIKMLSGLKIDQFDIEAESTLNHGIAGTNATVHYSKNNCEQRKLPDIERLINKAGLPDIVSTRSLSVFRVLAEAEAAVHGIDVNQVHFHEVGADDAIIDIVGTCAALYLLNIDRVYSSPLPLGRGEVKTEHGVIPLPAPATMEICLSRGVPVYGKQASFEMVTPTGAAIVAALAEFFGPIPAIKINGVGYGVGSHDPGYPNCLRVMLGEKERKDTSYTDTVTVVETAIDDMNPEIYSYLFEKLFEAGALEVYITPVQMKKNRPGALLTVLASPQHLDQIQKIIFKETTTIGLRVEEKTRIICPRDIKTINTRWGPIRVKYLLTAEGEGFSKYSPEYEDCREVASKSGLPLKDIYSLAENLFRNS